MSPDLAQAAREAGSVRQLRPDDHEAVIRAVGRAFYDDPVFSFLLPDDVRRARQLERGFDYFARRIWLPHEESYTTDSAVGGAFWLPPGEWHLSLLKQLTMMPGLIARIGPRDMPRLLRTLSLIEAKHPREAHFYLPVIGVAPEWQGKGLGTALLRVVLDRCDRDGLPAYLEASSERNRACYERNGFEVREELRVPGGGPPIWPMWRAPRS
ncbi:MAG TPA: GNAT family N-acetyltransferase [Thermoleophilaceae bacterium]|nr:GNAT family N-acetyltransferase [Thermoleophilaceae bacterium]